MRKCQKIIECKTEVQTLTLVWVVDKRIVKHLVESQNRLFELPVRVEFEYERQDGRYVEGTLKTSSLFNEAQVLKRCPEITAEDLNEAVEDSVKRDIMEFIKINHDRRDNT